MTPRKIIIDTDPGQDDAIAILLALASPELEVLGITAVAGNVPLVLTQTNARKICELAGRADIAVFAGAERPLVRDLTTAEYVHGKSGLDGPDLPAPNMPLQSQHAVDFIVDTVRHAGSDGITLCALGPLTNLALAFNRAPDILGNIAEIVCMGGGLFEGGNTTPAAEFNLYVDPHAADVVFRCGRPITLLPLDLTHSCLTTRTRVAAIRALGTKVGTAAADLLEFFERFDEAKYGTDGGPLHDPNVIAWLLAPDLYRGRHINVEIETMSDLTLGMSVADWWGVTDRPANVHYLRYVDADGFYNLLTERLARLP
ncbi:MAG: nucleoside hydrolase [Pseudomonadota bacterium]